MTFKYNPEDFDNEEDKGYLKEMFVRAYDSVEKGDEVDFAIYRSHILAELKIWWKSGVIAKSYSDEIAEYLWGLM